MVEIKRNYNYPNIVFEAKEKGEIIASITGSIDENKIFRITQYTGDKYLFDGTCRAALNNSEHEGAVSAVIEPSVPDWQLMLFGYKREIPSISDFFEEKNCNCTCKNQTNNV
ncbi:MAG: hypothetical protein K2K41_09060 [Ruminiclostridium sp.]|nr:hypothetical protein [Ruminiclostridium sp.]